jgi:hypothetical protein
MFFFTDQKTPILPDLLNVRIICKQLVTPCIEGHTKKEHDVITHRAPQTKTKTTYTT